MLNTNKHFSENYNESEKEIHVKGNNGSLKQREHKGKYLNEKLTEKLTKFVESRISKEFNKSLKF